MLPSRGLSKCLARQRLDSKFLTGPLQHLRPTSGARQFGTTLRTNASTGTIRFSQTTGLVGRARRTVVAVPGAAGAGTVGMLAYGKISPLVSATQVRNASTGPQSPAAGSSEAAPASLPDPATVDTSSLDNLFEGSRLLDMHDHIGYLKELGLEFGWGPTSMVQWALEHIHVYTGLPWWASIVTFAVGLRLLVLKPIWTAYIHSNKMQILRKDPKHAADYAEMQRLLTSTDPNKSMLLAQVRQRISLTQKAAGVSVMKTMLPMLQVPIGFGAFRLLNNAAKLPVPSFETGGVLWFTDLTAADPYYVLPMISTSLVLYMFRTLQTNGTMDPSQAPLLKMMQYILTPITFLATLKLNAGVQIYLALSSFLQIVQTQIQNQPAMRKLAGLPPLGAPIASASTPKIKWEAPRTINTTAVVHSEGEGVGSKSPIADFKDAWKGTREKIKSYTGDGVAKKAAAAAEEYEKRRRDEEDEKFLARRDEAQRKNRRPRRNQ
ncbi:hypothetical protein RB595_007551 [Gaeumannomyces hyphopodioides]